MLSEEEVQDELVLRDYKCVYVRGCVYTYIVQEESTILVGTLPDLSCLYYQVIWRNHTTPISCQGIIPC